MSIIHDALKKAQTNLEKGVENKYSFSDKESQTTGITNTPPESLQPSNTSATENKNNKTSRSFLLLNILIILFTIGSIAYFIFNSNSKISLNLSFPFQKEGISKPETPISTQEISTPRKTVLTKIALNGTMLMGVKQVALINGEIYEVGEKIGEEILSKIALQSIELTDQEGNIRTISVRHR